MVEFCAMVEGKKNYSFVLFALFFSVGILSFQLPRLSMIVGAAAGVIAFAAFLLLRKGKIPGQPLFWALSAAIGAYTAYDSASGLADFSAYEGSRTRISAVLLDVPQPTGSGYKVPMEISSICTESGETAVSGRWILYLPSGAAFHPFDRIEADVWVKPLPGNAAWLKNNGFLQSAQWISGVKTGAETSFRSRLLALRTALTGQIISLIPDPNTAAFAVALLLGERRYLDPADNAAFRDAGVIHILAISGMNVALVLWLLRRMSKGIFRSVRSRQLAEFGLIAVLFAYTMLSGASPSVVRASLMAGIFILTSALHLRTHFLNVLCLSGLLQLLFQPSLIFDPGFQLSYAAVLGIILFVEPLQQLMGQKMPAFIRENAAVTLSAQLLALPIILYHFQSFPAYFLLANLLLIPAASLAVKLGFAALLICWVPFAGELFFRALDVILWVMMETARAVAQLPGASVDQLHFSEPGLWVSALMAGILAMLIWKNRKQISVAPPSAQTLNLFLGR